MSSGSEYEKLAAVEILLDTDPPCTTRPGRPDRAVGTLTGENER
jgi:hypothetical protein